MANVVDYFSIAYGDDEELIAVQDYELGAFDIVKYWKSTSIYELEHSQLSFVIHGNFADVVSGPLSLLIISKRMLEKLNLISTADIEWVSLDGKLKNEHNQDVTGYYLIQAKNCISCIDKENSVFIGESLVKPAFDKSKIPPNLNVFRSDEVPGQVYFKGELLDVLKDVCVGCVFLPVEVGVLH